MVKKGPGPNTIDAFFALTGCPQHLGCSGIFNSCFEMVGLLGGTIRPAQSRMPVLLRPTNITDRGCGQKMTTRVHISVEGWTKGRLANWIKTMGELTDGMTKPFPFVLSKPFRGGVWLKGCLSFDRW